jgi:putative ABC transport system permease protein
LRLAIGADRISIMMMVVCESTVLSVVGGAMGVVLGVCASSLFALFSGLAFSGSPLSIVLGVGMSFITGVFFGVYPALKASQMSPVEALRSE